MTTSELASESPTSGKPANDVFAVLLREPLYWLLLALPLAVILEWLHVGQVWVFLTACVAIVPLAGLMGRATENLAETMGAGPGGLLNATFGNAAELIIALSFLRKGPETLGLERTFTAVKATITGSIIGNILLVLGLSMVAGGFFHKRQRFNQTAASLGATLLALAAIGLLVPSLYVQVLDPATRESLKQGTIEHLSEEIAAILAITYILSLLFSLYTHSHLFAGEENETKQATPHHAPEWGRKTAISVLLVATLGVAWMSELLVRTVEHAGTALGMSSLFIGVIVVAVIGNAAEHSTAVLMALKNKMDIAVNIAVGSSIQIALFVAPVLVFASMFMGHERVLDLHFLPMEIIAVVASIIVLGMVSQDGESHWMEGVMLLALYLILAIAFYHYPETAPPHPVPTGTATA